MSQIDPMMFQPFGFGPRGCIGRKFAEMEIKMAMCLTLRTFSFSPSEDTPVSFAAFQRIIVAYLYLHAR